MSVFISGGCKNGKSFFAQRMAMALPAPRYYVATMEPRDDEDDERVARHRREREGWGFETLEQPRGILNCLDAADARGAFLLDSATALLANEMFSPEGEFDPGAAQRVADDLTEFVRRAPGAVIVSDYIGSDAARYDEFTEGYRRALAAIDRALARACDVVVEVCVGRLIVHKGTLPPEFADGEGGSA